MTRRGPEDSDPFGEESEEGPPAPGRRPGGKGRPEDSDLLKFPFGESESDVDQVLGESSDIAPADQSSVDVPESDLSESDLDSGLGSDLDSGMSGLDRLLESDDPSLRADPSASDAGESGFVMADTGERLPEPRPDRPRGRGKRQPPGKPRPPEKGKLPLPSVPPGSRT